MASSGRFWLTLISAAIGWGWTGFNGLLVWAGVATMPADWPVMIKFAGSLLLLTAHHAFWLPAVLGTIVALLVALWRDSAQKTNVEAAASTAAKPPYDAGSEWSLREAIEHLERWVLKQPPPVPSEIRSWALNELRHAISRGLVQAYGEHFRLHADGERALSPIPPSFMKGARLEFQSSEGIDKFDGGLAYRERDETGYGGVRFFREEIEGHWPLR